MCNTIFSGQRKKEPPKIEFDTNFVVETASRQQLMQRIDILSSSSREQCYIMLFISRIHFDTFSTWYI